MIHLPDKKYSIIYADPPWSYDDKGCSGAAEAVYNTMPLSDICAMPVSSLAEKDAVLFMWATYPKLREALQVIDAWGFTYKSIAFQWVKLNPKGRGFFLGLGRWTRGNTEPCLLAVKGKPHRVDANISQLIISPLRQHSRKPDETRDRITALMGDLPRIELFARTTTPGWDTWGNEIKF